MKNATLFLLIGLLNTSLSWAQSPHAYTTENILELGSQGSASDNFGSSVAISSNGLIAAVGAERYDVSGTDEGSVSILSKAGINWAKDTIIKSSNANNFDFFGSIVSISDDGNTLAVGAWASDPNGTASGSIYVYHTTDNWNTFAETRITPSDGQSGDNFGRELDISGNGNVIIVGARGDDDNGSASGSAYIFATSNNWVNHSETKIFSSDISSGDGFGWSVSVSEDGTFAVVGASQEDNAFGNNAGAIYVFQTLNNWGAPLNVTEHKILAPIGTNSDQYGYSVSISGDAQTIVVGNSSSTGPGSAYVHTTTDNWNTHLDTTLSDPNTSSTDFFGLSVDCSHNGNVVIVTAQGNDDPISNSGRIYVYNTMDRWLTHSDTTYKPGTLETNSFYGKDAAMASSGGAIIIGAPSDILNGIKQGSAYVYSCNSSFPPVLQQANSITCQGDTNTLYALFGSALLRDADEWVWYTDSCGGTEVGRGDTIVVSPMFSTTYYVRGEGECPAPGPCGSIVVTIIAKPSVMASADGAVCKGSSIDISAFGSSNHVWDNGLGAGQTHTVSPDTTTTYTVMVTDGFGCTNSDSTTVTVKDLPTVNINGDTVICAGSPLTLTGNGADFYSWLNGVGFVNPVTVFPETDTSYTVIGTANNGCRDTASIFINVDTVPTVIISFEDTICSGRTIQLIANGANSYEWEDNLGSNPSIMVSPTLTTSYTVVGTAVNGCTDTAQATVNVTPTPQVIIDSVTNVSCHGLSDGAIFISVTGGVTPYTYNWNNDGSGPFDDDQDRIGLPFGGWGVNVKGANGCVFSSGAFVNQPAPITNIVVNVQHVTCKGGNDGSIVTFNAGGTAPYEFDWDIDGTGDFDDPSGQAGFNAGTHTMVLRDFNGCTDTLVVNITEPNNGISHLNITPTHVTCFGEDNGALDLTVTGNSGPYQFDWNIDGTGDNDDSEDLTTLPAGNYQVIVTDTFNCSYSDSAIITQPNAIESNLSTTICQGDSVQIGNNFYKFTGTSVDTLLAANGCDSVVTLDLMVINSATGTDTRTVCNLFTWIDGNTYTSSNNTATFNIVGGAANSCDSIVTLDLTVIHSVTGTDTRTVCNSFTWIDGNIYTADNNTATFNIVGGAANSCDSLVTLDLTIIHSVTGTDTRTECNSFTWIDGNTYTSSNNTATFTFVGGATNSCDSTVTLDLTIINSATGTDTRTECNSFTWIDGNTYTSDNNTATFNIVGGATNSCDSIVTLDLTIIHSASGTDTRTACNSFTWIDGNTYTADNNTATFNIVGGAVNSCDSLVTLDLTITGPDTNVSMINDTLIAMESGLSYQWIDCNGNIPIVGDTNQTFVASTSGNYAVVISKNGCIDTSSCHNIIITSTETIDINASIHVYPNPTSGEFFLSISEKIDDSFYIVIQNSIGKAVQRFHPQGKLVKFSLEEQDKGIYFVNVFNSKGAKTIKVIKQ